MRIQSMVFNGAFQSNSQTMKLTTKGITTAKNHLINLMTPIYFTHHQKKTAHRLIKEVAMRYLCEKLP